MNYEINFELTKRQILPVERIVCRPKKPASEKAEGDKPLAEKPALVHG